MDQDKFVTGCIYRYTRPWRKSETFTLRYEGIENDDRHCFRILETYDNPGADDEVGGRIIYNIDMAEYANATVPYDEYLVTKDVDDWLK
jgi:hypothetical protein